MIRPIPKLAFLLIISLWSSAFASERKEKKDAKGETSPIASPTLLVKPVVAEVNRGGEVMIPVNVIPYYGKKLSLELLAPPAHGKLERIRDADSFIPRYFYRSDPSFHGTGDSFRFRVKAGGLTWNTYQAEIRITEPPGVLVFSPGKPDFGKVPVGETSRITLVLSNSIGARISGNLLLSAPWRILGDTGYDLQEGKGKEFEISFTPVETGYVSFLVGSVPENRSFPRIVLIGEGIPPFLPDRREGALSSLNRSTEFLVSNPTTQSVTVRWAGDSRLNYSSPAEVPPAESVRFKVSLSHPESFVEGTTTLVSYLESGSFKVPVTLLVEGAEGEVLMEPSGNQETRVATPGHIIALEGIIRNHSSRPKMLQLSLLEEGDSSHKRLTNLPVPSQGSIPFSMGWSSSVIGEHEPKITLSQNGREITSASWRIRVGDKASVASISPAQPTQTPATPASELRKAFQSERERMVIWSDPVLREGFLRNRYVLQGRYPGRNKVSVIIQRKVPKNSLKDRDIDSEEKNDQWQNIAKVQTVLPSSGGDQVWNYIIPMPWPGEHEYRAYADVPGDKIIASQIYPVTWKMFTEPLLRDALILLFSLLVIKVIRDRLSR